jgi:hypothetical protein
MSTCDHYEHKLEWTEEYDDWTGETSSSWKRSVICLQEDIDIHRFKCTRCGEIGYYSSRARDYYENGIKCWVPGLDK